MAMNPLQAALSVRSDFSIGESSFQIDSIVKLAKEQGYTHIGLADLMTVSGIPTFTEKAKKAGLTPIAGVTLHIVDDATAKVKDKVNNPYRLKAYPKGDAGMKAIFAALTKSLDADHFYYNARLGLDDVLAMTDVIITSGDTRNLWHHPDAEAIAGRLHDRFGSNFCVEYVALDTPLFDRINQRALGWASHIAEASGYFPAQLMTRPSFYATDEDANATDVLRAITSNTAMDSIWLPRPFLRDLSLHSARDTFAHFKALSERIPGINLSASIMGIPSIVERCQYQFKKMAPSMPKMAEDEYVALVNACVVGWKKRFSRMVWGHRPEQPDLDTVYKERLRYELGVIKKMGFSGYFLLVQDIVQWSKSNGVMVGPGRGSVGGSLIAYLMEITDCDPIRFDLLFERFINPDRTDLPDADLDFESGKRHLVVDYVIGKYGRENVSGIVNFSTLGAASALRDTARMHGLQPWEYDCSKQMEKEHGVSMSLTESADRVPDIDKFRTARPVLWDYALRLEGANRSLSQHAAGVVVAGEPVINRAVVSTRGGPDALPVVQWDKSKVEDFGLIKIDVLGLNTLDLIGTALSYIAERHHKKIEVLSLPLNDERVLKAFGNGDTTGVFQFSGGGMRKLLKEMAMGGPLTFNDLCAATALFRPGPLDAGLCDRYVRVKQGASRPHYEHPALEKCLGETFGVITYQEQVMAITRELCGFTPGEADGVRKAIGKKDADKMAEYGQKFIDGAIVSGMPADRAGLLWETILGFAGYAFNKSHSCEYSLISWITMWLKVYYPAEFFAAAMTVIDKEDQLASLVGDAQFKKLMVLPPDLNKSSARIEIEGENKLYAPFQAIKGVSSNVASAIIKLRLAAGGRFACGAGGAITGLDPAVQKEVLGRTVVNSRHRESLERIGALHSITGEGRAPTHPERLRDRIELMPGFTVDMVKPDRELEVEGLAAIKITRLVSDYRSCEGCSLKGAPHPQVRMGSKPKFMVVFDAPTWQEERAGKMLEGSNADVIKAALKGIGMNAADGYYTSLVKSCKPKEQKTLTNEQINGCGQWLKQEIEFLKPPIIIAMGSNAVRWFSPGTKGSPTDLAGKVIYRSDLDASVIFGLNPGSLFHDPSKLKLVEDTFEKLGQLLA
jgi:DNA polymerase-3 subunit alpha